VDDFTLGVLFVAKRDDRGLATARVRTELWVDVSLDDFGEGLGSVKKKKDVVVSKTLKIRRIKKSRLAEKILF
jgi:predicted signal transduction protein with EAL and GGDEF domain